MFLQQSFVTVKPHMGLCRTMVSKWEMMGVPPPFAIYRAMLAVALGWQWKIFWHPVPLLSRNRQPLADQGSELVLPRDMLSEDDSFAYLKIIKPKTRYRGGGRVQHLSVQDSEAVAFLDAVFGAL